MLVGVENSVVRGNTISTGSFSPDAGIYVASRNVAQTDDITIENNNVCNVRWGINVNRDFQGGAFYTDMSIKGNTLSNTGGTADAAGIRIDAAGGNTITAEDNNIITNPTGALITSGTQLTFTNNNISGNTAGVDATGASPNVDAKNNFWGDPSGPSGGAMDPVTGLFANGSGDSVSTNVLFDPFLTSNPLPPAPACPPVTLVQVTIDIKFLSDPNAFNCKKRGDLPLTIFGTATLDVNDIDVSSLRLALASDTSSTTASGPVDSSITDRGDPSDAGIAMDGVDIFNPDGFDDLDVSFDSQEVATLIGCGSLNRGDASPTLVLIGQLNDGTPLESVPVDDLGIDQLAIKNK